MRGEEMYPCNQRYALPSIFMVAGATKNIHCPVTNKYGEPANVKGCNAQFCVSNASGEGTYVIKKSMVVGYPSSDVVFVQLEASDTIDLSGKYVYQIWIIGEDGKPEEPQQGELYIKRNYDFI